MKMPTKKLSIIFLFLFFGSFSSGVAQVVSPQTTQSSFRHNVFGLGLFGGAATGMGLSFRHHLPMPLSYQITGGIIKTDGKTRSDIGVEVQYDLSRSDRSRFYVAGGFSYFYTGGSGKNEMDAPLRAGMGIGGELAMSAGLHMLGDVLFTFFDDGTVLPLPQVGFFYYFN